ncbi:P-loop NTPase fold protein [Asanoa sp. NPDC050611]|uniref:KAP family P-loop NTPase fold protein n=1 Tax=Asanoa sp. NPDC050611 TaxID=3157098 RepID=UPI0033C310C4
MNGRGEPIPSDHSRSKILLDVPSHRPALRYARIAEALAGIIRESEPQFAVGIFGGWGAGKTTLMRAIRSKLDEDDGLVLVDFNAWRFEREPLLLVPLLDTIRAALVVWSAGRGEEARERLRSLTLRIGRVVRALATGLSGEVGFPGAVKVKYDVGRAIDALNPTGGAEGAQSLYVGAFDELAETFGQLQSGGVSRIVVFVDDLDRCLPENALDVLESMKLFFDLVGFVFVVGLDDDVVERAVLSRFAQSPGAATDGSAGAPTGLAERLSRDYVKKIFQVPYSLPPMAPQDLNGLLRSMYSEAGLGGEQLSDLEQRVRPYLGYVAVDRRVNPREVKRFVNAYTLQTLIRPELDRDAVLAVQTLAFRYEWESAYNAILADSGLFLDALRRYRQGDERVLEEHYPDLAVMPADLARFLRSQWVEPLVRHPTLDAFVYSLESTDGRRSGLIEAYRPLGTIRREVRRLADATNLEPQDSDALEKTINDQGSALGSLLANATGRESTTRMLDLLDGIRGLSKRLTSEARRQVPEDQRILAVRTTVNSISIQLDRMYRELQVLRAH